MITRVFQNILGKYILGEYILGKYIEWAWLGRWGAAKKLDLRGVELGGKCTYTSEHVQQPFSN